MAEAEVIRAGIASNCGLETLARADQLVRALSELGVQSAEQVPMIVQNIENALIAFSFRGFPTGESPSPSDIADAIRLIADGAKSIERGLSVIQKARIGLGLGNEKRGVALEYLQRSILSSIANRALPVSMQRYSQADFDATLPTASLLDFSNPWAANFMRIAWDAEKLLTSDALNDLANPTRQRDEALVNFVHRLGAIYRQATCNEPRADEPKPPQSDDWCSPFVRFFGKSGRLRLKERMAQTSPQMQLFGARFQPPLLFRFTKRVAINRGHAPRIA